MPFLCSFRSSLGRDFYNFPTVSGFANGDAGFGQRFLPIKKLFVQAFIRGGRWFAFTVVRRVMRIL